MLVSLDFMMMNAIIYVIIEEETDNREVPFNFSM